MTKELIKYDSDFNTLFPIVSKILNIYEVWNGNLYLHLDSKFNPIITGWLKLEKDSEDITIRLICQNGKWSEII